MTTKQQHLLRIDPRSWKLHHGQGFKTKQGVVSFHFVNVEGITLRDTKPSQSKIMAIGKSFVRGHHFEQMHVCLFQRGVLNNLNLIFHLGRMACPNRGSLRSRFGWARSNVKTPTTVASPLSKNGLAGFCVTTSVASDFF